MTAYRVDTPVAFFVYNRPEKANRVLERIATVEPETLFVVADGPDPDDPEDERRCAETRSVVEAGIDWDCDVRREFADENLGLRERFVTGLRWVFGEAESAILLEDDCLPNECFFRFCDEMLEEYRYDTRVMDVTGSNHLGTWKDDRQDYHFSFYGSIWGWATWRRSWERYDPEMSLWADSEARARFRDVIADDDQADYLEYVYEQVYDGDLETWDYQWGFARQLNSAVSVVPSRNLVTNIGFGEDATNTTATESEMADVDRYSLSFPLERREYVAVDRKYDEQFHEMRPLTHRSRLLRRGRALYEQFNELV